MFQVASRPHFDDKGGGKQDGGGGGGGDRDCLAR